MLTHLQIRDFAIIDSVELELAAGLTALTGETGAGKSILVDAVMLAIGARAGADAVRHGAERAEITATFTVADNAGALAWLEEQSVTHEGEVQLRRVIGSDGRSRAYVNGQTLPLQVVRALGDELVDIHGQQEFLSLTRRETQRRLLDGYGGHEALLTPVQEQATAWRAASDRLQALRAATAERASLLELLRYQVRELEALALEPGEVATLLEEQTRLSHRSRLAEATQQALGLVYEGDGQEAHSLAGRALAQLKPLQDIDARLTGPATLLQDALIQLREAGRELASYLDALDMDPARRDHVERRVAAIEELARKHRIAAQDLPAQLERLRDELQALERAESSAAELETQLATAARLHAAAAEKLSAARRSAAKRLGTAVTDLMRVLGMPGGQFEVAVAPRADDTPSAQGRDDIDFLVSANPGQPPRSVARVASGGELSRISLAVQVAAVDRSHGRLCMIFDEVDAGVGGGVAERVGQQLHALGTQGQVLCVTHLPQVASQADQQVRVAKLTDGRTSRTSLATLDRDERIEELARMLGGVEITQKAREHAAEMLKPREAERTPRRRETRGRRGA